MESFFPLTSFSIYFQIANECCRTQNSEKSSYRLSLRIKRVTLQTECSEHCVALRHFSKKNGIETKRRERRGKFRIITKKNETELDRIFFPVRSFRMYLISNAMGARGYHLHYITSLSLRECYLIIK